MSNRTLITLSMFVLAGMALLLGLNLLLMFYGPIEEKYVSHNDVRGSAIVHKNKEYTFNFAQQRSLLAFLNEAEPIGPRAPKKRTQPIDFEKIRIYLFNKPDIEIIPIVYEDNELVFSTPGWEGDSLLKDTSAGKLKAMLSQSFDP